MQERSTEIGGARGFGAFARHPATHAILMEIMALWYRHRRRR